MEVSVIIPVYNAAPYLDQCIQSALDQPEVSEVLTVDDGSIDGSYEKLEKWTTRDERVKLFTHPNRQRRRAAATRNIGLRRAKAEYIAFLDADDYFLEGRFHETAKILNQMSGVDMVFNKVQIIEDDEASLKAPSNKVIGIDCIPQNNKFDHFMMKRFGDCLISGFTFKRELIARVGYMDASLHQKHDKDYIWRLFLAGNAVVIKETNRPVVIYRYHQDNTIANVQERRQFTLKFHEKWLKLLPKLPISLKSKLWFMRNYMVCLYRSYDWGIVRKLISYPILYVFVLVKNYRVLLSQKDS